MEKSIEALRFGASSTIKRRNYGDKFQAQTP